MDVSQYILGIQPTLDGLKVDPCIPHTLGGFTVGCCFFCTVLYTGVLLHEQNSPILLRAQQNKGVFLCAACQVWLFREHFSASIAEHDHQRAEGISSRPCAGPCGRCPWGCVYEFRPKLPFARRAPENGG